MRSVSVTVGMPAYRLPTCPTSPQMPQELATIPQTTSYDQPYGGGGNGSRSLIVTQLQHARSRLVLLQTAYTDAYPDVIAAKHEVAQLEAQLNGAKGEAGGGVRRAQMPRPDLPRF